MAVFVVAQQEKHHHVYKDIDYYVSTFCLPGTKLLKNTLQAKPHYEFKYSVHDPKHHDVHEQKEKRIGDKVEGEYSIHDPDGTIRVVKYEADKHNGFNAVVERKGHAIHPQEYKTYH